VLETAAGTGAVTRAIAAAVPTAALVSTDLNQAMLDHAAAGHPNREAVQWQRADALALPFEDASFDAVVCQFGAMFFPDKTKGYAEARRVVKPDGQFLFSVWGPIADNEFADVVTEALARMFPDDPPRFLARTPHGYNDGERIRDELKAAGFSDVSIETVDASSDAASARDPAVAYCHGTPLRNEIEARAPGGLARATDAAAQALADRFGTGAISGRIQALVITASA
jgi:ubiquinone/menaquinone biosynthesis C-methylase UbiE